LPIRLIATFAIIITLAGLTATTRADQQNVPPQGFTALFNGKDFAGWHGMGHFDPHKLAAMSDEARQQKRDADWAAAQKHWRVEDGDLVNDGKGPYLITDQAYGDIELMVDYKTVAKADSGIYLRATPQVQIWDFTQQGGKWHLGADKGSGGLWNNRQTAAGKDPLVLADKPFGQWNRLRIRQVGARTSVWLNDKLVVDNAIMDNFWDRGRPLLATGPIQLQTHGGEIRWRNIFLREIPTDEANVILRGSNDGFQPLFNGKDFAGWAGPVENYEIRDGAIVCRPGKGGTIYTKDQYQNFVVRLEFKLPPAGNNGLAIRYPGQGDPAYIGMCELRVLDSEHPRFKNIDPRQAHGSAYGMAAAARGYLRANDQWNYQQVTVNGSTIQVELNGSLILNTDLSQITDYLANRPHPGKDRHSGHFGIAGHLDPVEFRNIHIKRLNNPKRETTTP